MKCAIESFYLFTVKLLAKGVCYSIALVCCIQNSHAEGQTLVDFEEFGSAPSVYNGALPPLRIGKLTIQGGQLLSAATLLPVNRSVVYGTSQFCSGCASAITISFDDPVSEFSVLVMNGTSRLVSYTVQDDQGGVSNAILQPNHNSGAKVIQLESDRITTVTVSGFDGSRWNTLVDDIRFRDGDKEYRVMLSNFIPHDHVIGPPQARCGSGQRLYYAGDARGFSPSSQKYRSRQTVTVTASEGIKDGTTPENSVGLTKSYASNALLDGRIDAEDDDAVLADCHLLHEIGRASAGGMRINVAQDSENVVSVMLSGAVGNPLVAGAPATDWNIELKIDEETSNWYLTGMHDGFPAYEIYINDVAIYTYLPGEPPYEFVRDVLRLFPPVDVTVNLSGPLAD